MPITQSVGSTGVRDLSTGLTSDVETLGGKERLLVDITAQTAIPISTTAGTSKNDRGTVVGVIGVDTTIATITITATKVFESIIFRGSATKLILWKLIQHDDGVNTTLIQELSVFNNSSGFETKSLQVTAGASGVQELRLIGRQLIPAVTDLHGYIEGRELA